MSIYVDRLRKWGEHIKSGDLGNKSLDMTKYRGHRRSCGCLVGELPYLFKTEWGYRFNVPVLKRGYVRLVNDCVTEFFGIPDISACELIFTSEQPNDRDYHAQCIFNMADWLEAREKEASDDANPT